MRNAPTHLWPEVEVVFSTSVTLVSCHAGLALAQPIAGTLEAPGTCRRRGAQSTWGHKNGSILMDFNIYLYCVLQVHGIERKALRCYNTTMVPGRGHEGSSMALALTTLDSHPHELTHRSRYSCRRYRHHPAARRSCRGTVHSWGLHGWRHSPGSTRHDPSCQRAPGRSSSGWSSRYSCRLKRTYY